MLGNIRLQFVDMTVPFDEDIEIEQPASRNERDETIAAKRIFSRRVVKTRVVMAVARSRERLEREHPIHGSSFHRSHARSVSLRNVFAASAQIARRAAGSA